MIFSEILPNLKRLIFMCSIIKLKLRTQHYKKNIGHYFFILFLASTISFIPISFSKAQSNGKFNDAEYQKIMETSIAKLLSVADNEQGEIGKQIREIAEAQSRMKNSIAERIERLKNVSKIKEFIIGTNDRNVGLLLNEIAENGNQIGQLKRLLSKITNESNKIILQTQIKILEEEQQETTIFFKSNKGNFSLFGWFFKII